MERLLTGLTDFTIKKVLSYKPSHLEATYDKAKDFRYPLSLV